ncbi:YjbH domain-containing protein [Thauera phenolivorans]|uniref:YjbH domain-containing protein n=1 Tax=Thauera phenolivorans TaxID=1792543 RepID=UPI001E583D6A|nr:YjbH domain-containing protein [Thauera phenolivorans]
MRLLSPWGQGSYDERGGAVPCRSAALCAIAAVVPAVRRLSPWGQGSYRGWLAASLIAFAPAMHAQDVGPAGPRPVASDFGGVGLLQMPTARMAEAGELSVHFSKVDPYTRFGLTLQPFDWLEATFAYTDIRNRLYGPAIAGDQSLKDKGFDFKLRLLEETAHRPQLALGARDIGGTGLFSGEYLVASKRHGTLDFTLGLGWGYLGNADNVANPLGWLDDRFDRRPGRESGDQGGNVNTDAWFRGPAALFGGVQWQTPWAPLQLIVEYDGNDYSNEPQNNDQDHDSPFNLGAVYRVNDWLDLRAGWERGNTAMIGVTLHANLARRSAPPKLTDPPAPPLRTGPRPSRAAEAGQDWAQVARELEANAGYRVSRIARREREIVVEGEQTRYFHAPKAIGRSARILDHAAAEDVDWLTVVDHRAGMPVAETSLNREAFRAAAAEDGDADALETLIRSLEHNDPSPRRDTELFAQTPAPFTWGAGLGYRQNLGGPDSFILYQLSANLDAEYRFAPGTWLAGRLSGNLANNFDRFDYDAPSGLPRVRTDLRSYWTESDLTLPLLQLTHARRLGGELFGMVYGGYLESMFAGFGAELLHRPMNSDWALGVDFNWVKQRDFDQDFGLRNYDTVTGHLTGYYRGLDDVLAKLSVGRYLAGDYGATLDLSREFHNGVRFGAWATVTDASDEEFGEGSFDKGIYVSIPFDELMTTSTLRRAELVFAPLTRDGGARLERAYGLFGLTEGRHTKLFQSNHDKLTD